jgi:hypothetical protein
MTDRDDELRELYEIADTILRCEFLDAAIRCQWSAEHLYAAAMALVVRKEKAAV